MKRTAMQILLLLGSVEANKKLAKKRGKIQQLKFKNLTEGMGQSTFLKNSAKLNAVCYGFP
ncbi:MAG: hypothetical protein ACRENG_30640, partial [bacterium]